MNSYRFLPEILRAYDVRGIVGKSLTPDDAFALGRAFAFSVKRHGGKTVGVAYDGRLSSPLLAAQLIKGLVHSGMEVTQFGLGPTPMLYYGVSALPLDSGVMITGSHNPPDYNGFKMTLMGKPFFGDDIMELGKIAEEGLWGVESIGRSCERNILEDYLAHMLSTLGPLPSLKVAWDPGNGATGEAIRSLITKLPGDHILLNGAIDGTFPAHHPDPTVEKNLEELIKVVQEHGCDLGLAFDGDGDRLGVVTKKGHLIMGDQLLTLFAEPLLKALPGAKIIGDVKASGVLFSRVKALGGVPIMCRTGHSFIKAKMAETGAVLAGEVSGHFFFKDRYFGFDDGIYAALRTLEMCGEGDKNLDERLADLPFVKSTPEVRVHCEEALKFKTVDAVKENLLQQGRRVVAIDGVRVASSHGWWLLRASNTEAALVIRCEGSSDADLDALKQEVLQSLEEAGMQNITLS